jgi:hypothetical protein
MVNWLKSLFKKPEPFQDITAREAQVIAEGSLLVDDDKDFMVIWKDVSKKIKELSGKNIRKLEIEITQKKYVDKISPEFVTQDLLKMNPGIGDNLKFSKGSLVIYCNYGFISEFTKCITDKIKAKGFDAKIYTHYQYERTTLNFIPDGGVKQTLEITW